MGSHCENKPSVRNAMSPGRSAWHSLVLSYPENGKATAREDNRAFALHMANLRTRPTLDVDVVDHCNLNCACCNHFSPISQPGFLDPADFERDLALLSNVEAIGEFFSAICLMGGEPLLHPDLAQLVRTTRRYLPRTTIRLVTNGILLEQAPSTLWEALRDTRAEMLITPYPTGLDYDRLASFAAGKCVKAIVGGGLTHNGEGRAFFLRMPLDPAGTADPVKSFVSCSTAGAIMQLRDGRIYPCNKGAFLDKLNARFGTDFEHKPEDGLELTCIRSAADIDTFRRTPKPMCRYCAQSHMERVAWERSGCAAGEWLIAE